MIEYWDVFDIRNLDLFINEVLDKNQHPFCKVARKLYHPIQHYDIAPVGLRNVLKRDFRNYLRRIKHLNTFEENHLFINEREICECREIPNTLYYFLRYLSRLNENP